MLLAFAMAIVDKISEAISANCEVMLTKIVIIVVKHLQNLFALSMIITLNLFKSHIYLCKNILRLTQKRAISVI